MSIALVLAWLAFAFAAIPFLLFFRNLRASAPPPAAPPDASPSISVLIPARNEEASIGAALDAVLGNRDVDLEVVVLDYDSDDGTGAIVADRAARDPRVRLERAPPLPAGWCGKQHACAVLAPHARRDILVFVDADVRLAPDALARIAGFLRATGADLVSGFPRQETVTLLERLLLPFMHFLLLGFLRWTSCAGAVVPPSAPAAASSSPRGGTITRRREDTVRSASRSTTA